MDSQVKTPPPEGAIATPPAQVVQPTVPAPALPPAPVPTPLPASEPVQATGALDANGLPAPIPQSPDGGVVITDKALPAESAQSSVSGTKPSLAIAAAVVLFVALCGIALFAYSQSK